MKRLLPALVVLMPLLAAPAMAQDYDKGKTAATSNAKTCCRARQSLCPLIDRLRLLYPQYRS
jgi:hypothetical protein